MALRKFIILQDRLPSHSLMKSSLMECLLHIFDMRKGPKSGGEIQKPNPCGLRFATVGAKRTSTGRSAPSRSVYLSGGLRPATETSRILIYPPLAEAGVFPTEINLIRLSGLHEKEFQKTVGKSREETN